MKFALYGFDGVTMFHLSTPLLVFDEVRRQGLADWETVIFSDAGGSIRTAEGYDLGGVQGPDVTDDADMIIVPSWFSDFRPSSAALTGTLLRAHEQGHLIAGLCLGAFAVVDAGLLDGRSATTHWRALGELAARNPAVRVSTSTLYLDQGDVLTSAGTASSLDACLHIVRRTLGADAAIRVARGLVLAPHREGGQAQFIERPVARRSTGDPIDHAVEWALSNLTEPLDISQLAAKAHMSERTFVRSFRDEMGTTPAAWVRSHRLEEARRLLEITDLAIDQIAAQCGFRSSVTFRQNFVNAFGCTPSNYRNRFGTRTPPLGDRASFGSD